ncbi:MAG: hypothetical protein AAF664_05815, partial [Planctomycetota bacterium]
MRTELKRRLIWPIAASTVLSVTACWHSSSRNAQHTSRRHSNTLGQHGASAHATGQSAEGRLSESHSDFSLRDQNQLSRSLALESGALLAPIRRTQSEMAGFSGYDNFGVDTSSFGKLDDALLELIIGMQLPENGKIASSAAPEIGSSLDSSELPDGVMSRPKTEAKPSETNSKTDDALVRDELELDGYAWIEPSGYPLLELLPSPMEAIGTQQDSASVVMNLARPSDLGGREIESSQSQATKAKPKSSGKESSTETARTNEKNAGDVSVSLAIKKANRSTKKSTATSSVFADSPQLRKRLEAMRSRGLSLEQQRGEDVVTWTDAVSKNLDQLRNATSFSADTVSGALDRLDRLALRGGPLAEAIQEHDARVIALRAVYALRRRLAIWRPIHELHTTRDSKTTEPVASKRVSSLQLSDQISEVRNELEQTGDVSGWENYLMLEEVESASRADRTQQMLVAQRVLSRLEWHRLLKVHRQWLENPAVDAMATALRTWASSPIDYGELLRQLERQESDPIDLASIDIATATQSMRFDSNPNVAQIAGQINTHYRNANVRLAMSRPMLDRLLPAVEPERVRIQKRILGSQVRGVSYVQGTLGIDLMPSADRWRVFFENRGQVTTHAVGRRDGVRLMTLAQNEYTAIAPIEVTSAGAAIGDIQVDVYGRSRLRGVTSDYDSWPLLGTLVRGYAQSEFRSVRAQSNSIAKRDISVRVTNELQTRLDDQIDNSGEKLSRMVLGP